MALVKINETGGKDITDLRTLFNEVKYIYYKKDEYLSTASELEADINLPVIAEGVSFDTGSVDLTEIKLTDETLWTARAKRGDANISFQVASIDGIINDTFLTKIGETAEVSGDDGESTYNGALYSLTPKQVGGSLILISEDESTIIVLCSIQAYANLVAADGDNPAYFNMAVKPLKNSEGGELIVYTRNA